MPLDEYRRKRDFAVTPEPEAVVPERDGSQLFFCVQKHLASHLHYDIRLELNGVLLSWAVPKGPSLDPGTKRLAMQTEDHPFAYGEFEGVIPEGYGAGIVMLWDKGTWKPEVPDIEAALRKGDLKFTLDGYKLKGSWVLVRTSGRYAGARGGSGAEQRTWLLIKHRDDWSSPELDIAEFAPYSVKSGGDFEDILADDNPAIWQTNRPAKDGSTGAMLAEVVARAAAIKAARAHASPPPTPTDPAEESNAAATRKKTAKTAGARKRAAKKAPAG